MGRNEHSVLLAQGCQSRGSLPPAMLHFKGQEPQSLALSLWAERFSDRQTQSTRSTQLPLTSAPASHFNPETCNCDLLILFTRWIKTEVVPMCPMRKLSWVFNLQKKQCSLSFEHILDNCTAWRKCCDLKKSIYQEGSFQGFEISLCLPML